MVHTPEDRFELDPKGKAPGRGAYLCPDPACLQNAARRKGFDRAFKQSVPREAVEALEAAVREMIESRKSQQGEGAES